MNAKGRLGRTRAILPLAAVFLLAANISEARYSGGTGEPNNPYRIATPNDLNDISNHPEDFNDCFILVNDINMSAFTYTTALIAADINDTNTGFQGTPFTGIFDGNDCIISNFTVDTAGVGNDYLGLFGQIEEPGEVNNLGIEDVNIAGGSSVRVGGLVGANYKGTISDCYATGTVSGSDHVGGLVGSNYQHGATITKSYATGTVRGYRLVGGLVGHNYYATIENCYGTASVSGFREVGGLAGYNYEGSISTNCYATGDVWGALFVGGLVGYNNRPISACYATGRVTGDSDVGGLVGRNSSGPISNSYATGSVTGGDNVGGLMGVNGNGPILDCYATGRVTGDSDVGALVGYDYGSYTSCFWDSDVNPDVNGIGNILDPPEVIGETTQNMQIESTFTDYGWDFVGELINGPNDIWDICQGTNYPRLVWQIPPADFLCPDGVSGNDYAFFADHWGDENCGLSDDCDGTDLDSSDAVDGKDLKIFCQHWLEGAEP